MRMSAAEAAFKRGELRPTHGGGDLERARSEADATAGMHFGGGSSGQMCAKKGHKNKSSGVGLGVSSPPGCVWGVFPTWLRLGAFWVRLGGRCKGVLGTV